VQGLAADAASSQDSALGMLSGLADAQQALAERLEAGLGQLRREMRPSLHQARADGRQRSANAAPAALQVT
jgi:hypothetical protein